jgi:DNA processing protein
MTATHLPYWLAALYLPGIGPRRFMRWLEHFRDIKNLFNASQDEWREAGITEAYVQALRQPDWKTVEADLAWAQEAGRHLLTLADADYPSLLKEISDPPLVLFVRGDKMALSQVQIAVVGSRHATSAGLQHANEFSYHLAQAGFAITSGLALGIDGASHKGALAAKGVTIGVAGTGLHHSYPKANQSLEKDILECHGAIVSEFPLASLPHPKHFPRRNRIISGLSVGVLVVEAALKSGSLITAYHALEQGREVFAIPGSIHHPLSRGCHHLIRQGAKLVETAKDVLEELGSLVQSCQSDRRGALKAEKVPRRPFLAPPCDQILTYIGYDVTPIDVILLRSGLTMGELSSILLTLELSGYINSIAGGYIRVTANH